MSKNPRHLPFGKAADSAKVIVFVAMEGWSLKGGQGDYVRELAQALGTQGHQVFVVNPYYARPHADIASDPGQWLDDVAVPLGGGTLRVGIWHNQVGAVHYLRGKDAMGLLYPEVYPTSRIDNHLYSDTLYGYIEAIVLSRLAMHMMAQLGVIPDILHFHDWQSSLGPVYMEAVYRHHPAFTRSLAKTGTVLTVHNLAYQGMFPGRWRTTLDDPLVQALHERWILPLGNTRYQERHIDIDLFSLTRLPGSLQTTTEGGLEYWAHLTPGQHNLLKGGVEFADKIVAVSQGNGAEMQSERLGFGLGGVMARRAASGALDAIYNGVATEAYTPEHLPELLEVVTAAPGLAFVPFSATSPDLLPRRAQNKAALRAKVNRLLATAREAQGRAEQMGFGGLDESRPSDLLMVSISRLVRQKGLDILLVPLPEDRALGVEQGQCLLEVLLGLRGPQGERLQFLLLGTAGDAAGEQLLATLADLAQNRLQTGQFAAISSFDPRLANQIRCATDLFFMPSQYEPGGVANIQAALGGALCIVTRTGGLLDFVAGEGTHPAFTAPPFDADAPATLLDTAYALVAAFQMALRLYTTAPQEWETWVRSVMTFSVDWSSRVPSYLTIYASCLHGGQS
jgi:starch synthase